MCRSLPSLHPPAQVLEVACGVWHTAAIVQEPECSLLPAKLQQSPLKPESPAPFAGLPLPPGTADLLGSLPGLPPASPAHRGAAHQRNNSTSSAFSEVRVHALLDGASFLQPCPECWLA